MLKKLLAPFAVVLTLAGCSSANIESYQNEQPTLDLAKYFNGVIDGHGMFQDRSGQVVKRFHVVIVSHWQNEVGTLDEDFTYSDGTKQRRIWTITKLDATHYEGRAADVVGVAKGIAAGNALRWNYVLALPVGDKIYKVNFEDWFYLQDDKVLLNRSFMSKFGFRLGELTLSFSKRDAQ
ncbi:MAG: DUF3833 domain-containing protein [Gallionella sp.]|nr:DUF3833 domain-containing protein [Gallionella sp.]